MKKLIALLSVLGLALAATLLANRDPGFVGILWNGWTLKTSFSVFLILLFFLFILFYLLVRLFSRLWSMPERLNANLALRRQEKTHQALVHGLSALAEQQWTRAEQELLKHHPSTIHYLAAAYAAQVRGDLVKREEYFAAARQDDKLELGLRLWQARLHLLNNELNDALGILNELQRSAPKHSGILALLQETYTRLESWENLLRLMPELRKRKVVDNDQAVALESRAVCGLLRQAAALGRDALTQTWAQVLKSQRLLPDIAAAYAGYLRQQNQEAEAESLLRDSIKHHWHSGTVKLYGMVDSDPAQQLNQAEKWFKGHEKDPVLLLTLGRLCMRNRLWGKAQQYLEQSLDFQVSAGAYQTLGELQTQLGEHTRAAQYYLKALQQAESLCVSTPSFAS
jgi:HemY protein